ncbi:hypothetical protein PR048_014604 [Dryococelus australis]|uniref:Uncharacterized protein n=1 Tax=Dryococelus australis TaxID=614101 RepID=A0ABQ9HEX0_9NEOP|nr:hypothetical protein PR048_014604 [Dryococelus australis]
MDEWLSFGDRRRAAREVSSGRKICDCKHQSVMSAAGRLDYWTGLDARVKIKDSAGIVRVLYFPLPNPNSKARPWKVYGSCPPLMTSHPTPTSAGSEARGDNRVLGGNEVRGEAPQVDLAPEEGRDRRLKRGICEGEGGGGGWRRKLLRRRLPDSRHPEVTGTSPWARRQHWSGSTRLHCAAMKWRGEREIPEKICRPAVSSSTIPTCENPRVGRTGFEPGSLWWDASRLTAKPPRTIVYAIPVPDIAVLRWRKGFQQILRTVLEVCERFRQSITRRVQARIQAQGGHIENFLVHAVHAAGRATSHSSAAVPRPRNISPRVVVYHSAALQKLRQMAKARLQPKQNDMRAERQHRCSSLDAWRRTEVVEHMRLMLGKNVVVCCGREQGTQDDEEWKLQSKYNVRRQIEQPKTRWEELVIEEVARKDEDWKTIKPGRVEGQRKIDEIYQADSAIGCKQSWMIMVMTMMSRGDTEEHDDPGSSGPSASYSTPSLVSIILAGRKGGIPDIECSLHREQPLAILHYRLPSSCTVWQYPTSRALCLLPRNLIFPLISHISHEIALVTMVAKLRHGKQPEYPVLKITVFVWPRAPALARRKRQERAAVKTRLCVAAQCLREAATQMALLVVSPCLWPGRRCATPRRTPKGGFTIDLCQVAPTFPNPKSNDPSSEPGSSLILVPMRVSSSARMRGRETGDPREDPRTNGFVRHDSHIRRSGVTRPGIEPGSLGWRLAG